MKVGNRSGLNTHHVGSIGLSSPSRSFHLNNILHIPSLKQSLIYVSRFTKDNNVSIEFIRIRRFLNKLLHGIIREAMFGSVFKNDSRYAFFL